MYETILDMSTVNEMVYEVGLFFVPLLFYCSVTHNIICAILFAKNVRKFCIAKLLTILPSYIFLEQNTCIGTCRI